MKNLLLLRNSPLKPVSCSAAIAATLLLFLSSSCSLAGEPVGTELVYEVDQRFSFHNEAVDMGKVIAVIKRRMGSELTPKVRVEPRGQRQLRILVSSTDQELIRRIEARVERTGSIEFRVLANNHDHQSLIKQARKTKSVGVRDETGKRVAAWLPISRGSEKAFMENNSLVTRTRTIGDREFAEALTVEDIFQVNGSYLKNVTAESDDRKKPCIVLHFDWTGGRLLAGLTGQNLPDPKDKFVRQLAIILDGMLYGALPIKVRLYNVVQITGDFSEEEAHRLADILNAGSLSVLLRQVQKRATDTQRAGNG